LMNGLQNSKILDLYCGGGGGLFAKPESKSEVYNDLQGT